MLQNNYLTFGNSIMQKYGGMVSRINPLALIFLTNEEEEPTMTQPAPVTNVSNYFYNTNHYIMNHIANRYITNYRQIVSTVQSNPLYTNAPNFKMDVHPVQLNHTSIQTMDTENLIKETTEKLFKEYVNVEKIQEKTTETVVKQIMENFSSDTFKVLPGKLRETVIIDIEKELTEKVLPVALKQTEYTVLTKEVTNMLEKSLKNIMEKNTVLLPVPIITDSSKKLARELTVQLTEKLKKVSTEAESIQKTEEQKIRNTEFITTILVSQLTPYIMSVSSGTSRGVIQQEIHKVCQSENITQELIRELEHFRGTVEKNKDTIVIKEILKTFIQKTLNHTDVCKKGKEKFENQIINRLVPLPIRPFDMSVSPVNLSFEEQQKVKAEAIQGQDDAVQNQILQQKVVQIIKNEYRAEKKFYTHFIDRFLKEVKETKITETDRRELPAGIIYHQKPKETVKFVSKDVISVPMELLNQSQSFYSNEETTEIKKRINNQLAQINNITSNEIKNVEINKSGNVINHEIRNVIHNEAGAVNRYDVSELIHYEVGDTVNNEVSNVVKNVTNNEVSNVVKNVTNNEVHNVIKNVVNNEISVINDNKNNSSKNFEINTIGVSEYIDRRIVRRQTPKFTIQHSVKEMNEISNYLTSADMTHPGYGNGALELTFLVRENPKQDEQSMVKGIQVLSQAKITDQIPVYLQSSSIPFSGNLVAPVSFLHKPNESRSETENDNKEKKTRKETEYIEQDIVFTKDIVTKQSITNDITESVNMQQERVASGQLPSAMKEPKKTMISDSKMEEMISKSVSKHMDENINAISRQVYRSLERQIKKEQERRGK